MKELTIEQKAQKYDEALERYKAKQEYESQKVHEFIEYLFPELKESEDEVSEDERVKKTISSDKVEHIVARDFNSVFSREQVEEIDKRIEESQRLYNAKLRDAMRKVKDFPMTN